MTTRKRGELPSEEEALLGIERETPEQEAERERIQKEKQDLRREFLTVLMSSPDFREWLMEKLISYGTFEKSFGISPGGFPDHQATEYQQGLKAAGWDLWCTFDDVAPEMASKMRRERMSKT